MNAIKNLKCKWFVFRKSTKWYKLKEHLLKIKGVKDVHHIHIRSIDGYNNYTTMHIIANGDNKKIKEAVKEELKEHGIIHTTIELEDIDEICKDDKCKIENQHNLEGHKSSLTQHKQTVLLSYYKNIW